jgi:hypothetical protein
MRYLSALLLIFLCSCATKNPELASEQDSTASASASAAARPTTPDFYRKYTGVLAGQNITAHLTMKSGKLGGTYYYDRIGIPITLWPGAYDAASKRHELQEQAAGDPQIWRVAVLPGSLQGTWTSGSQAFDLNLAEAPGAKLVPWVRMDSLPARENLSEPKGIVGVELLLPASGSLPLEQEIIREFSSPGFVSGEREDGPASKDINEFWERSRERFFRFYRETTAEVKDADLSSGTYNFTHGRSSEVYFDRDDFLVLGISNYEYTGGAHGNGGTNYLNYDLRSSKLWKLGDMMKIDSAKIIALLDTAARAQYNIPAGVPLKPNIFNNELYLPHNYFVTHKGITFSYWPYDIATYAQGEIQLFIPWSELRELLRPEFVQRLGI